MQHFMCVTCGTQFAASDEPPADCPICLDERQYVHPDGQQWTTLDALRTGDYRNVIEPLETNLFRIKTEPRIGIGQWAHLVRTPAGNVLWDTVPLIDEATVSEINALGGLSAIAISHPHFHTSMVDWSRAFRGVPVYIHIGNRENVVRPDPALHFWDGDSQPVVDGVTLVRCGGHFTGSAVLHWRDGAGGRGSLLTSDTIDIVADTRWASFMRSYPNLIPLSPNKVRAIAAALEPFAFERMYESFGGIMQTEAKARLRDSADRYIRAITDD